MPIDPTVNVLNQELQGGADWEVGGVLNIDTAAGGKLTVGGVDATPRLNGQPASVTITPAAGSANVCNVTIQVKDGAGNAVAFPVTLDVLLSDASSGAGLTATGASGAVASSGTGTDLSVMSSKKAIHVQTNASGQYVLSITDTAKTNFYVVAAIDGMKPFVVQVLTSNYG